MAGGSWYKPQHVPKVTGEYSSGSSDPTTSHRACHSDGGMRGVIRPGNEFDLGKDRAADRQESGSGLGGDSMEKLGQEKGPWSHLR